MNCTGLEESGDRQRGRKKSPCKFELMNHNNLTLEESQYNLTINKDNNFFNERSLIL